MLSIRDPTGNNRVLLSTAPESDVPTTMLSQIAAIYELKSEHTALKQSTTSRRLLGDTRMSWTDTIAEHVIASQATTTC